MSVRTNIDAMTPLALIPLAALLGLASGLAFFPLIFLAFFAVLLGKWFGLVLLCWSIAATCLVVRNGVACMEIMGSPDWRQMAIVAGSSFAAVISCPFLWLR